MAAVTVGAVVVDTWGVGVEASTAAVVVSVVGTTAAEVMAAGITEAVPMVAVVTAAADTPGAPTAVPMVPEVQLHRGLGHGKAIAPLAILLRDGMDLMVITAQAGPERQMPPDGRAISMLADRQGTSHLTPRQPTEIGTLLARLVAQP